MLDFFEWLGGVYGFYRASQDAGMWLFDRITNEALVDTLFNLATPKEK